MSPIGEAELKAAQCAVVVAGQGPGDLFDVCFAVVAFAQHKELHQLARKVLVRPFLGVVVIVQVVEHGRITDQLLKDQAEV